MVPAMIDRRLLAWFVLAVSVAALAVALTAQFGFSLRPCVLCLAQRVPFVVAGLLAAGALLVPERWRRPLLLLAGLAFLVNAGIAVYHVGVEQKWWASAVCPAGDAPGLSVDDLAALMQKPAEVRCDEPAWAWHGVTMAAMNVVFSGLLAVVVLAAAGRRPTGEPRR